MGKQVNFYMIEQDEAEFLDFALDHPDTVILGSPSLNPEPLVLDGLPQDRSAVYWRDEVLLWKPGYPLFIQPTVMKAGPHAGQKLFFVDELRSSVVQFVRSILLPEENLLTRGRIWADMRRLEGDHFVYKGQEFERWYDTMAAWIRKRYRKIGERSPYFYIGPQAYEWYQAGGRLQPR